MFLTRAIIAVLFAALLAGCGGPPAAPTAPPVAAVPIVGELLDSGATGQVTAAGYLFITPEATVLADGLAVGDDGAATPIGERDLWVEAAPALPVDAAVVEAGPARYALVEASGTVEGPASYGPGGRYAYRLVAPKLRPLRVSEVTIALLLQNSGLYEGQAVRLAGELLAVDDSAILAERLGPGGVPASSGLELKLATPPDDPGLLRRYPPSGSSDLRYGPVEVTGIWRSGALYPLLITPRPPS